MSGKCWNRYKIKHILTRSKFGICRRTLSIIIPIYNTKDYLYDCLQSVYNSIKKINAEVILVDDGSDDGSSEIAQYFKNTHKCFKYFRTEHNGVADARNYGVSKACGKYIGFVDSDDIVINFMYEKLLVSAEMNNADIAIIDAERFNSYKTWGSVLHRKTFDNIDSGVVHIKTNPFLVYDSTVWNKIIRRHFWENRKFCFPKGYLYEDVAISIPLHYEAKKVVAVREIGYRWRDREGSNKSITQNTHLVRNLNDRLYVLDLLFHYSEKNMKKDNQIIDEMKRKFLTIDIKMFVEKSFIVDPDTANEFREKISLFLMNHYSIDDFNSLDDNSKELYRLFLDSNEF